MVGKKQSIRRVCKGVVSNLDDNEESNSRPLSCLWEKDDIRHDNVPNRPGDTQPPEKCKTRYALSNVREHGDLAEHVVETLERVDQTNSGAGKTEATCEMDGVLGGFGRFGHTEQYREELLECHGVVGEDTIRNDLKDDLVGESVFERWLLDSFRRSGVRSSCGCRLSSRVVLVVAILQ